jgi:hypothetical protein
MSKYTFFKLDWHAVRGYVETKHRNLEVEKLQTPLEQLVWQRDKAGI